MSLGELWAALRRKEDNVSSTALAYLNEIDRQGEAKKVDFFKITNNQEDLEHWIKLLENQNFIEKNSREGTYIKTEKGQIFHEILKKHEAVADLLKSGDLISTLTQKL
jgi:hypothetical protein